MRERTAGVGRKNRQLVSAPMSADPWRFQRWAFEQPTGSVARKAVLQVLAMMADKESGRCEAKQATIAQGVELSERAVRGHLRALERMGLIARRAQFRGDGRRRGDEYLILAADVEEWPDGQPARQPADSSGGQINHRKQSSGHDRKQGSGRKRKQGSGLELPLKNNHSRNPTVSQSEVDLVWGHYETARKRAIPRSRGFKLADVERRVIRNALKVRDIDACKAAIDGLFRSDYHLQGGYIGIKYALLGGGRSPDAASTIDRLASLSRMNGRGKLKDKTYQGLAWDELTERAQHHVREAAANGLEVWDGGKDAWADREEQLAIDAGQEQPPVEYLTADNFALEPSVR